MEGTSTDLVQLVYASAAKAPFSPAQLAELLRKARLNNQSIGVPGVLLYHQ